MSSADEKSGLQEREIIAIQKVAATLEEIAEEIAGGFAVLTESIDDLTRAIKRKDDDG